MMRNFRTSLGLILINLTICFNVHSQDKNSGDYNFNSKQTPVVPPLPVKNDSSQVQSQRTTPPTDSLNAVKVQEYAAKGDIDSLKWEILNLRKDLNIQRVNLDNVQRNLYLSHKKFRTGTILMTAGIASYFLATFAILNTPKGQNVSDGVRLLGLAGFGSTITGFILMINSHKYIGKAGTIPRRYNASNYRQY